MVVINVVRIVDGAERFSEQVKVVFVVMRGVVTDAFRRNVHAGSLGDAAFEPQADRTTALV